MLPRLDYCLIDSYQESNLALVIAHIYSRLGSHAQSSDGVGAVAAELWEITGPPPGDYPQVKNLLEKDDVPQR